MQTAVIFNTKADAQRVRNRLRNYGVLSQVVDREVRIEITKHGEDRDRELAIAIWKGEK
jgi:hypothetical protein